MPPIQTHTNRQIPLIAHCLFRPLACVHISQSSRLIDTVLGIDFVAEDGIEMSSERVRESGFARSGSPISGQLIDIYALCDIQLTLLQQ